MLCKDLTATQHPISLEYIIEHVGHMQYRLLLLKYQEMTRQGP